ncbi:MAG: OpgC family protein [Inquilinaceae bacterium]
MRDPRLDFFRGIGMFIIFVAHVPSNPWTLWIPARFGFSDATEIFVFCSGMASALAFGGVFARRGWLLGTARIVYRVWQVYWSHIGLFFVIAGMMVLANASGAFDKNYVSSLNLMPFFRDPAQNLLGLLTLTYVPNYFDILPMYLVILALIPVVMALAAAGDRWLGDRGGPILVGTFVAALWLAATFRLLDLPAEPWSQRVWFFNPFAWQLVFFTGFAFIRGWLKPPPVTPWLIAAAVCVVLATVPFAWFRALRAVDALREVRQDLAPLIDKTHFGILRYVHFLALAYLGWLAAGEGGRRLTGHAAWTWVVGIVRKVGQQSLAVFLTSLVLAQAAGIALDVTGRGLIATAVFNLIGFGGLIAVAYTVGWFKSTPWKRPAAPAKTPSAPPAHPIAADPYRRVRQSG